MANLGLSHPVRRFIEKTNLTAEDVCLLKVLIFTDGLCGTNGMDALLALENGPATKCAEWTEFFVSVLSDHVVNRTDPAGHMTDAKAEWLLRFLAPDGIIGSRNAYETLVRVIELSGCESQFLARFALDQIRHAVIHEQGPLMSRRKGARSSLDTAELNYINRILAALGFAGVFTLADAEALFESAGTADDGPAASAWQDFVDAVALPCTMAA